MNVIELRKADDARGWLAVPESCPARFVASICEKRALSIQTGKPIPNVIIRSARPVVKSLEQQYFENTGREARHFLPSPRRPGETLEAQMERITREIRGERFQGFMSADEKEYWSRQFAARTGLEIKTYF
jgi:hypothetical protein